MHLQKTWKGIPLEIALLFKLFLREERRQLLGKAHEDMIIKLCQITGIASSLLPPPPWGLKVCTITLSILFTFKLKMWFLGIKLRLSCLQIKNFVNSVFPRYTRVNVQPKLFFFSRVCCVPFKFPWWSTLTLMWAILSLGLLDDLCCFMSISDICFLSLQDYST